ncbi:MAG: ABC transporter permease [Anaerolineaceae bacterium]|nr:ABC transporter permease [Anaerolineaceae bacterium]
MTKQNVKAIKKENRKGIRKPILAREAGVFFSLILMCLFLSIATESFLGVRNLLNVGRQISLLGIMSIGMTFVLITGEIDLSIGSIYALSGIVTGLLIINQYNLYVSITAGLVIGVIIGFLNGFISTYGKLPSFITTLGMMSVVRGIALLITDGQPVAVNELSGADPFAVNKFYYIGQGRLFDVIPMQLVFLIIIAIIGWLLLSKTVFGFKIYAVGGSEKASHVSGIKVFNIKIWAFTILGFLTALSGILMVAFMPSTQGGRTGVGRELDVIAATVVGGASLAGGEGTVLGTILGCFIIGVLRNGLVLMGISPFWQEFAIGVVIILAVAVDMWTRNRSNR